MQYRIASAREAWGPLVKSWWTNRNIAQKNKNYLFGGLVAPRLLYNTHIWSWFGASEMHKIQDAFKKICVVRSALGWRTRQETNHLDFGQIADAFHMFVWKLNPQHVDGKIPPCLRGLHQAVSFEDVTVIQPDYHGH